MHITIFQHASHCEVRGWVIRRFVAGRAVPGAPAASPHGKWA